MRVKSPEQFRGALDELLAPCNFPPCDPLRGEAVRELEALRAELTTSRRAPSPAVKALVAAARPLTEIVMKQCSGYTSGPGFDAAQLARVAIEALAAVEREIGGA